MLKTDTLVGIRDAVPDGDRPTLAVFGADEFARESEELVAQRDDERWLALAEEGVFDLERAPRLAQHRSLVRWSECDDVEVHVLLRAEAGATIREMLRGCPHDCSDVVRAVCRLARRGVLKLT